MRKNDKQPPKTSLRTVKNSSFSIDIFQMKDLRRFPEYHEEFRKHTQLLYTFLSVKEVIEDSAGEVSVDNGVTAAARLSMRLSNRGALTINTHFTSCTQSELSYKYTDKYIPLYTCINFSQQHLAYMQHCSLCNGSLKKSVLMIKSLQ